jgi:hypothetical protein
MTVLTDEQESMIWAIFITGVSTHWASLACRVGIDLDGHAPREGRFIGNHALQLSKRPFRMDGVRFPLLFTRLYSVSWSDQIGGLQRSS